MVSLPSPKLTVKFAVNTLVLSQLKLLLSFADVPITDRFVDALNPVKS